MEHCSEGGILTALSGQFRNTTFAMVAFLLIVILRNCIL